MFGELVDQPFLLCRLRLVYFQLKLLLQQQFLFDLLIKNPLLLCGPLLIKQSLLFVRLQLSSLQLISFQLQVLLLLEQQL